ncbi:hypothetical protein, partial [Oleiphilus sp. HI0123]|uniref:hypothetical protein n=1 Tax=Oleiphilus sp. HI0123 TaxID=1822265 RepID=UPI001E45B35A
MDGGEFLLFDGEIRQARDLRESVTDRVLDLLVTDKSMPRNYAVAVGALNAGHTMKDRAELAFKGFRDLGVKIGYICDLMPGIKFPRGFTYAGDAKKLLREVCRATQTSWS